MRTALGVGERSRFLRRADPERDLAPPPRSFGFSGERRFVLSSISPPPAPPAPLSLLVRRARSLDRVRSLLSFPASAFNGLFVRDLVFVLRLARRPPSLLDDDDDDELDDDDDDELDRDPELRDDELLSDELPVN